MDIRSRRALSKAIAALVFSAAVTGGVAGNVSAGAYDGSTGDDGVKDELDLGTSVKSLLGTASNYNVFLSGNYRQTIHNNVDAGDGQGVLAVGGNYDVGVSNSQKCASATVAGNVTGTIDGAAYTGANCNVDFESAFAELKSTSAAIASVEATEGTSVENAYGTITMTGTNADVNVFNFTVAEWNALKGGNAGTAACAFQGLYFKVPDGSTVVVNITGSGPIDLTFNWGVTYSSTGQLTSGNKYGNSKVLFNIPDGNNVVIGSGVGTLLAPESDIVSSNYAPLNAHYEGQVIGRSFSGNIEFGSSTFDDTDISNYVNPVVEEETEEEETPAEETTEETEETTEETEETSEETTAEEEETPAEDELNLEEITYGEETPTEETTAETETPVDEETDYEEITVPQETEIDFLVTTAPEVTEVEEDTTVEEETTAEETTVEEEAPVEETTVEEEAPVEETTVEEEAPVEETTVEEEAPVEETTVEEEAPIEETTVEEEETEYEEITVPQTMPISFLVTTAPEVTEVAEEEAAPVEETTVEEEAPVEETTVEEEAPVEETTVEEEAPVEETTVEEEAPVEETTVEEEAPVEEAPAEETPAVVEDAAPVADPVAPVLPPYYVPAGIVEDAAEETPDELVLTEVSYDEETEETVDEDDELVLTEVVYDSDDDTMKPVPQQFDFEENETPLGEFDFDANPTPLGEFPNFGSSDNPATGVASPIAAGTAALASLAVALKSRKKRK